MNEKELFKLVGSNISNMRRNKGMTQEQVSQAIGLEVESVSRIETGATAPTLKRLHQFSQLFGCHIVTFFPTNKTVDEGTLSLYDFSKKLASLAAQGMQQVVNQQEYESQEFDEIMKQLQKLISL